MAFVVDAKMDKRKALRSKCLNVKLSVRVNGTCKCVISLFTFIDNFHPKLHFVPAEMHRNFFNNMVLNIWEGHIAP